MIRVHEHKRRATLKRVTSNNGQLVHNFVAPEFWFEGVPVVFWVDASAVGVPARLDVLAELEELATETMGSCTTSFVDEFWALAYELPPPRT
jgi:hypothetical protein